MLLPFFVIVFIRYLIPKALTNYYLSSSSSSSEIEEEEVCLHKEEEAEVIVDDAANYVCSKLDCDIFGEIFARLSLSDQARFRAVCKIWLFAAAAAAPPQDLINNNRYTQTAAKPSLPWYAHYNRVLPTVSNTLEFRIYDTSSSSSFLHIISLTKLHIPAPLSYSNIWVTCHKNWFLIDLTKPRFFSNTQRYFFLYSCFTKRLIKLPRFDCNPAFLFIRTFTTHDPDSPSCVFVLLNGPIIDRFAIVTCRKGDTEWTVREFPNTGHDAFLPCVCTPLFFRGMLYIVSQYGQLASYDVVDGEFRFVSLTIDHLFALNYDSFDERRCKIFELNGELMILYFVPCIENMTTLPTNQCLKQFDWSNKVWIPVSSLGGKTLFVSNTIYQVAEISTEQIRYNGILSNKIYHFFHNWCIIYSLEDGVLVEFKSINLLEGGGVAYRDYNRFDPEGSDTDNYMYLEPPVLVH